MIPSFSSDINGCWKGSLFRRERLDVKPPPFRIFCLREERPAINSLGLVVRWKNFSKLWKHRSEDNRKIKYLLNVFPHGQSAW